MGKKIIDKTGLIFYRWTVLGQSSVKSKTGHAMWICKCECGTVKTLSSTYLTETKNKSMSCGCLRKEVSKERLTKQQHDKYGNNNKRFMSSFIKTNKNSCWNWTGTKDTDGYGIFYLNGTNVRAHRYSYIKAFGLIVNNNVICHKCDNPSCVNPHHLFQGQPIDNVRDMIRKGRDEFIGSRNHNAKLTEKDIPKIRKSSKSYNELAISYNVSDKTIGNIKRLETWRHVK